jgi:hypothetical protein
MDPPLGAVAFGRTGDPATLASGVFSEPAALDWAEEGATFRNTLKNNREKRRFAKYLST